MTTSTTLKAARREGTGKGVARKLRQDGRIPAVLYGREMESVHISLDTHDAEYRFQTISVDNTIVELEVEGDKEPHQTLVREIQTHPWKATLVHVDFLRIQKGVAVDVDVPVSLVGIPAGVSQSGGVLDQIIHDLPVRCIPSKIPEVIEIDVSALELNEVMHISDVTFEDGIEVRVAQERTICAVSMPKAEEEVVEEGEELEEGMLPAEGEAGAEGTGADSEGGEEG